MTEKKKFHFQTETSLGFVEGDLNLEIDGNDLKGSIYALGAEIRLVNGHYEDGHFSGKFSEVILFTPVEGTVEGDINGDECTAVLTTASGKRTIRSM